ncbi:ATP-binding protein [Solibacillus sp. FSL H8-0538]|uniref:ATP-binding protein n=1 Tax=Solibacillus sp. FSL H8-0538 TaxID=2921400 RepID=UPI0030F55767
MDKDSFETWSEFIEKIEKEVNANCTINLLDSEGHYKKVKLMGYFIPEKQFIFARVIVYPLIKDEKERKETTLPFDRMIKNISHGVILSSINGKVITANNKALELIRREHWQVVNRSHDCLFEDFNNNSTSVLQYYGKLANNELATIVCTRPSANGETSYFHFESKIDNNLSVIITTITDETEKIRLLEKIEHQQTLNLIGQLAASIAHEIRNPMTSLQGFLQLIKSQVDEENQHYFTIMESELQRIDLLVSDLLNLSKPKTIEYEHICFLELVKEVIDLMQSQAIISNTIIEFTCDETMEYSIIGNKTRLKQMAINMIKNGIEAMPYGGSITVQLLATAEQTIEFIICDEGQGMDQQTLENLFNPFYTTKTTGTGLGLVMVKKVVEEHNGKIEVQSKVGKGSQFKLILNQFNEHSMNYYRHLESGGTLEMKSQNISII